MQEERRRRERRPGPYHRGARRGRLEGKVGEGEGRVAEVRRAETF